MSATSAELEAWEAAFEATARVPRRAPWLEARRAAGWERFRARGFPTQRDEDWMYTDLRGIAREAFRTAPPPDAATLEAATQHLTPRVTAPETAARLVFVNGWHAPSLSTPPALEGLEVESLAAVLGGGNGAGLEPRLGALRADDDHPFQALNGALWQDGVLLRIESGASIDLPVHLVFVTVGTPEATAIHPRLLVLAAAESRAAVLETWVGDVAGPWLSNVCAEVYVETGARVEMLEVQDQPRGASHFRTLNVDLAHDASFAATCITTGASLARTDARARLGAAGANVRLDGLILVDEDQHADHLTHVDHAEPRGTSRQLYKGVLADRASVGFSGKVLVHPHAQKTSAEQANHNLLLSDEARADAKPQLEIYADDVKCSHGATVGQLDPTALFYLRSRGLSERAARRLLLRAFAGEICQRLDHPVLREQAEGVLSRRIPEEG